MLHSPERIASYCYSKSDKELVTYDTVDVAMRKAQYIKDGNLGYVYFFIENIKNNNSYINLLLLFNSGGMYWELSGDVPTPDRSIVINVALAFQRLDGVSNHLDFPRSKFDNLRNGMN